MVEIDDPVIVRLNVFIPTELLVFTLPTDDPLGTGRLNKRKSANCNVSNTRYHEDPNALLKNMVIFNNTRRLYKFFSFSVIFANACCCWTDNSVKDTAVDAAAVDVGAVPKLELLKLLLFLLVAPLLLVINPDDNRGIVGIEFLQRLVKNASRGVTKFNTPQTLVMF